MRDAFVLGAVFTTVAIALRYPFAGILCWYFVSFLNPHRLTYGFAFDFQIAVGVALTTLLAFIFSTESKKPPNSGLFAIVVALLVWIGITTLDAYSVEQSMWKWETATKVIFMALVTAMLVTTRERIHALVWLSALTLGYFGVKGGFFTVVTGGNYRVWGPPGSFIADNNQLALALITIMPIMIYLSTTSPFRWVRYGMWGVVALTFFAVIGTHSRGGLVGIVAMGGFLVWRTPYKAPAIIATVLLISIGIWFVPEAWVARMYTIKEYESDYSAISRLEAWTFAFRYALDNPITGGGFHVSSIHDLFLRYVPEAPQGRSFHSIWFEMLGAHGFVGLAIFIIMLSLSWLNCSTVRKRTYDVPQLRWAHDLASMTQVSLVGYMAAGTFLNLAFFDLLYTLIAVIIGMRVVVERELSGQPSGLKRPRRGWQQAAEPARPQPRYARTSSHRAQKPV